MTRLSALLILTALAVSASAQTVDTDDEWCDRQVHWDEPNDWAVHCEVRTVPISSGSSFRVDGTPNGGIRVHGWNRDDVELQARVRSEGRTPNDARALAQRVTIETNGTIRARAPEMRRGQNVSVSFRLSVPHASDLDLSAHNGGIQIQDVTGAIRFETRNGGVSLDGLGGDVRGRTANGGLRVRLTGQTWNGEQLDVATTNGRLELDIPRGYSAELESGTVNGSFYTDFPILVQGEVSRRVHVRTTLGDGGALIRLMTTNGSVSLNSE